MTLVESKTFSIKTCLEPWETTHSPCLLSSGLLMRLRPGFLASGDASALDPSDTHGAVATVCDELADTFGVRAVAPVSIDSAVFSDGLFS